MRDIMINIFKNLNKKEEKISNEVQLENKTFENIDPYSFCIINPYFKA
jgi:hypothetical protein